MIYILSLAGVILCSFIYLFFKTSYDYWRSKNVPFKEPSFIFGNVKERIFLKKSFHEFHEEIYNYFKGNKLAGLYEGTLPNLLVLDPELIKTILTKDFEYFTDRPTALFRTSRYFHKMLIVLQGKEWKQVRSAVTPAFSSGKLKAMMNLKNRCGEQLTKYITDLIDTNEGCDIDMKETLGKFTLDVIATTAFGVELNSFSSVSPFSENIGRFNEVSLLTRTVIFTAIFLRFPAWLTALIPVSFFNEASIDFLVRVIKQTTQYRTKNNYRRNDFLQLLIDAQDKPLEESGPGLDEETRPADKEVINEDVAIAQAIIFFIAGFETSGTLLTMASYELAKNPGIQEKLRKEIVEKLKSTNGEVTYDILNEMSYLDMVLAESLRMYPPVARLDRICTRDYDLLQVRLKPGDRVGIPVIGLHRDPDYYPEPEKFIPERFTQEEKARRHPFVYLPFGAGPRNCIGMRAAQLTTKVCIVHLLKNFKIEKSDKTEIPFEFNKRSMLLKAKNGVVLRLSPLSTGHKTLSETTLEKKIMEMTSDQVQSVGSTSSELGSFIVNESQNT